MKERFEHAGTMLRSFKKKDKGGKDEALDDDVGTLGSAASEAPSGDSSEDPKKPGKAAKLVKAGSNLLQKAPSIRKAASLGRSGSLKHSNSLNASSLRSKKGGDDSAIWQDREIRFDVSAADLEPRPGEIIVQMFDDVEDSKGNNGDHGAFIITNLRCVWISAKSKRVNLCLGYHTITGVNNKTSMSRLKGACQSLFLLTKWNGSRFEFIFTLLSRDQSPLAMFTCVQQVYRAYDASRLYRDMRLRSHIVQDREIKLLPKEQVFSKLNGVWNLSSEQGNLGTFFVTNVRCVWFANMAENFNVSIPFLQIKSVRVRESKFGPALVIETCKASGGYILGFKVDPIEKLQEVYKEIHSLHQVFTTNPNFGVEVDMSAGPPINSLQLSRGEEDVEIVENTDNGDVLAAYLADAAKSVDREPAYNADIGLAMESLKDGQTVGQLWSVV